MEIESNYYVVAAVFECPNLALSFSSNRLQANKLNTFG